jgi:hypothetical protein
MPAAPRKPRTTTVKLVPDVEAPEQAVPQDVIPEAFAAPARKPRAKRQVRQLQSAATDPKVRLPQDKRAKEAKDGPVAQLAGEYFGLTETIGIMPLMEWAASVDAVDVRNVVQLASFYRLLKAIVIPEDWDRFKQHATDCKCTDEDLYAFQGAAIEAMSARPTKAPVAS